MVGRSYKKAAEELAEENEQLRTQLAQREPVDSLAHANYKSDALALGMHETATALAAAQGKAHIEARFTVALNRPRSIDASRVALLKDCRRPNFAEVAVYKRPVGGGKIAAGPSIRFAEAAARAWGNLEMDARTLYDSPEKRIVSVQVTDLESNSTYTKEITINKTVERRKLKEGQTPIATRTNSTGQTVYIVEATEDDLLSKGNSLESKALRTQIIRHLPGDLVDEATQACNATLRNQDAQDPDAARKRIVDGFAAIGVPVDELAELLEHDLGSASPTEMEYLRGIYTSIREGELSWSDAIATVRADRGDRPGSSGSRIADIKAAVAARAKGANGGGGKGTVDYDETTGKAQVQTPQETAWTERTSSDSPAQAPTPDSQTSEPETPPESPVDRSTGEVPPDEEPSDEELGLTAGNQRGGADPQAEVIDHHMRTIAHGLINKKPYEAPAVTPEPDRNFSPERPDCPDCGNSMIVSASEPDHYVCIPCNRYEPRNTK